MEISEITDKEEQEILHSSMRIGDPHEALFLVLAYLPLFELLAISQVCSSLRGAVSNDILPWLEINVKRPLNSRLSDDVLMKIASKANGRLRTLALINCVKITDDGLQKVIEKNPLIRKLYVPACTGLTPDGVVRAVKTLAEHSHNLVRLKINGLYNIKKEHLETLHSILVTNLTRQKQQMQHKETYRLIDTEICPKCNEARMVFDCPRENCKRKKQQGLKECKGCYYCIPRCVECGGCVELEEMGEAACADILCSDCWLRLLPKCNFCNRPYCNQHADHQCNVPGSSGFVCDACHMKFLLMDGSV